MSQCSFSESFAHLRAAERLLRIADEPRHIHHEDRKKLMEEISFDASERDGEAITITAETVAENVADLAKNADVRKFIL